MKRIVLFCLLLVSAACSKQSSEAPGGCDSSGSTFGDSEVNCRVSDVLFSNLQITQSPSEIVLTAGEVKEVSFTIINNGDESISGVTVANESGLSNIISNCETLLPGQSCSAKMELYEEKVSSKFRSFKVKDSRLIDNTFRFNYSTKATVPSKISKYKIEIIDEKTKKIIIEELVDKFNNLVIEESEAISKLEKVSKFNAILNIESESDKIVEVYGDALCNNLIGSVEETQVNRLIEGRQRIFIKLKGSENCIDTEAFYDIDLTAPVVVSSEIEIIGTSASTDPNIHSSNTYPSIEFNPKDDIKEILLFGESSCSLPEGGVSVTNFDAVFNSLQLDVGNSKDFRIFAKAIDASGNISDTCTLVKHVVVDGEGPELLIVKLLNESQEELIFPTNKLKPSFLDIEQTADTVLIKLYKSVDCSGNTFTGLDSISTATRLFPLSSVPNFINGESLIEMSAQSFDPVGNPSACVPVGTYVYDGNPPIINKFESSIDKELNISTDKLKINGTLISNINVVVNEDINNIKYYFNKNNCNDSPDFAVQVPNGKDFEQEVIIPEGLISMCVEVDDLVTNQACLCKDVLIDDKPGLMAVSSDPLVILNAKNREVVIPVTLINQEDVVYKLYRNNCSDEVLSLAGNNNFEDITVNDSFLNGADIVNIFYSSEDNFGNIKECSESEIFMTVSNDLEAPSDTLLGFFDLVNDDEALLQLRVKEFSDLKRVVLGNQEEDIERLTVYMDDDTCAENSKVMDFNKEEITSLKAGINVSTKLVNVSSHVLDVEKHLFYGIIIDDSENINECHPIKNVFLEGRNLDVTLDNESPQLAIQVLNGDPAVDGETTTLIDGSNPPSYVSNFINFSIIPSLQNDEESSVLTYLKGLYLVLPGESCGEKDLIVKDGEPVGNGSIDARFVGKGMELRADLLDEAGNNDNCKLISTYVHDNGNPLEIEYQSKFGIIRSLEISDNILAELPESKILVEDFDNTSKLILANRFNLNNEYPISLSSKIINIREIYYNTNIEKCFINGEDSANSNIGLDMIPYREDITEIEGFDNCLNVAKDMYQTEAVGFIELIDRKRFYITSNDGGFTAETIVTRVNKEPTIVLDPISDSVKLVNIHYNNECTEIPNKVVVKEELGALELLLDDIPTPFGITTRTEVFLQLEDHFGNKGQCELALDYTYKGEDFLLGNIPEISEVVKFDEKNANRLGDRAGVYKDIYMTNGISLEVSVADPSNDIQEVKYSTTVDCSNPITKTDGDGYSITGVNNTEYNIYGILVDNEGTESDCHELFRIYNSNKESEELLNLEFIEKGLQLNTIVANISEIHEIISEDISYTTNFIESVTIYGDEFCSRNIREVNYDSLEPGIFVNEEQNPILSYKPNFNNIYSYKITNRTGVESDCFSEALEYYEDTLLGKVELINVNEFVDVDGLFTTKETNVIINATLTLGGLSTLLEDVDETVDYTFHYDELCEGPVEFSNTATGIYSKFSGNMNLGPVSFILPENTKTSLYARVTDTAGNTSCDLVRELAQDSIVPLPPEGDIAIKKGSSTTTPLIVTHPDKEDIETIEIYYENPDVVDPELSCNNLIQSIPKAVFSGAELNLFVDMSSRQNSKISVWGKAIDPAGNSSSCSLFGLYEHDTVAPVAEDLILSSIPSINVRSDALTRTLILDGEEGLGAILYADVLCSKKIHQEEKLLLGTHLVDLNSLGQDVFSTRDIKGYESKEIKLYGFLSDDINNTSACLNLGKSLLLNETDNNLITIDNYMGAEDIETSEETININFEIGNDVISALVYSNEDKCNTTPIHSLSSESIRNNAHEITVPTRIVSKLYAITTTNSGDSPCQAVALINQTNIDIPPSIDNIDSFAVGFADEISVDANDDGDDIDADGDVISYSCKVKDTSIEPIITKECDEENIEFNSETGELSWVPGSRNLGEYVVTITAEAFSASTDRSFGVIVINDGLLFFAADDGRNGKELWVTNGEVDGTRLLKNINETVKVNTDGKRYQFIVSGIDSELDDCLEQINSCEANSNTCSSVEAKCYGEDEDSDLFIGNSSLPDQFITMNQLIYFTADDGIHGRELWVSDGSAKGTKLVKDINEGERSSDPRSFVVAFNPKRLYFSADTFQHGRELWTSDGSTQGTQLMVNLLKNGASNSSSGDLGIEKGRSGVPKEAKIYYINNSLYFSASSRFEEDANGSELMISNGLPENEPNGQGVTPENTYLFYEAISGGLGSSPDHMTLYKDFIYFSGVREPSSGVFDREVHRVTALETEKLLDDGSTTLFYDGLGPSQGSSSYPASLNVFDDTLYFTANKKATNGSNIISRQLLFTEGDSTSIAFSGEFNSNQLVYGQQTEADVRAVFPCGENLYFAGVGAVRGSELWMRKNGENTRIIETPEKLDNFQFRDGLDNWSVSGSASPNTSTSIRLEPNAKISQLFDTIPGKLYSVAVSSAFLQFSNGRNGLVGIANGSKDPLSNDYFISKEYPENAVVEFTFIAEEITSYIVLHLNGTEPAEFSSASVQAVENNPAVFDCLDPENSTMYFTAFSEGEGREPWITNGTPEGTFSLGDLNPNDSDSVGGIDTSFGQFKKFRDSVYFQADNGTNGKELWITDGTKEGTSLFKDIHTSTVKEEIENLEVFSASINKDSSIDSETGDWIDRVDKISTGKYRVIFKENKFNIPPEVLVSSNASDRRTYSSNITINSIDIETVFNPSEEISSGANLFEDQPFSLIASKGGLLVDNIKTFQFSITNVSNGPIVNGNSFGIISSVTKVENGRFLVRFREGVFPRFPHIVAKPIDESGGIRVYAAVKKEEATLTEVEVRTYNNIFGSYNSNGSDYDHDFIITIDKNIIRNKDTSSKPSSFGILE
jgi:ELWxxDGT repeat protein